MKKIFSLVLFFFLTTLSVSWVSNAQNFTSFKKIIERWSKGSSSQTWGKHIWQEIEFPTGEAPSILPGVTIDDDGVLFVSYGDSVYSYENERWIQIDVPDIYVSEESSSSSPSENAVRLIQHERSSHLYGIADNVSRGRYELLSYTDGNWVSFPFPPEYSSIIMHVFDAENIWFIAGICHLSGGCSEFEGAVLKNVKLQITNDK